jgi:hypothetical protein
LTFEVAEGARLPRRDAAMPWMLGHAPDLGAVTVSISGSLPLSSVSKLTQDALSLAAAKGTRRFLADLPGLERTESTLDLYSMPTQHLVAGANGQDKTAVLLPVNQALWDDVRFYETVCRNRGLDVRIFAARTDAVRWLTG